MSIGIGVAGCAAVGKIHVVVGRVLGQWWVDEEEVLKVFGVQVEVFKREAG